MINFDKYEVIIFDFDGVIVDSMSVRDSGFRNIFSEFDNEAVEELVRYNRKNGGLSRFHKIKYFYEEILKLNIEEELINKYAEKFTEIMKRELINPQYIIKDSVDFIKSNKGTKKMYIASGSENKELNYLCKELGISDYFIEIYGSPTHKNEIVKNILKNNKYDMSKVVLIGDSINDYEAAKVNEIDFIGYNNLSLKEFSCNYVDKFLVTMG
ncbi:hydrolase/phosphatase, HAD-like superfamily protein [Clostridium pasteurianum DSM 525 = ATCC 6013]|jgi:HAD superfamily hydrolase (TIGR01549 family)|uniref:HAD-superfamily hydrolase, subfamily IA, variant 1 n=1 Tax=Clostridium pasteurianum DSM 525 = ATCC 6013 TaxID=1262449 RepID=A0A0H3J3B4_CLOPA|nr:HAD-IA family hydrolase [Clostridium pasteurianum]AJA47302.1 hydrolase/phosphatase, HAD-like superfamily protein [Clostridium pasteurianum DSM 525 = ATCC 6013]AJA51290.1 hydrolase/phosphatase, HAD-like superfamily protein [Clostridium pasteurianum DSM 525 = ATCC 6013]AOZ74642.1 haloacid dehalogenase [Clostridium pasteurianum DSM 525 = ATCC 6013]AOZ78439.1 haloacid dehalogenase [Clostridium pasteurianum]ELP57500.1 hydrolase/phosphatase, HAD_like superfamily protein [Clostridium pasteurianum 